MFPLVWSLPHSSTWLLLLVFALLAFFIKQISNPEPRFRFWLSRVMTIALPISLAFITLGWSCDWPRRSRISFYLAFSPCFFCTKSLKVQIKFLSLATLIHEGVLICLGKMVLGKLYESLSEAVKSLRASQLGGGAFQKPLTETPLKKKWEMSDMICYFDKKCRKRYKKKCVKMRCEYIINLESTLRVRQGDEDGWTYKFKYKSEIIFWIKINMVSQSVKYMKPRIKKVEIDDMDKDVRGRDGI